MGSKRESGTTAIMAASATTRYNVKLPSLACAISVFAIGRRVLPTFCFPGDTHIQRHGAARITKAHDGNGIRGPR